MIMKKLLFSFLAVPIIYVMLATYLIVSAATKKPKGQAEYLLVLGARVFKEGISLSLKARLDTALSYLREHPETKVIVSGGRGKDEPIEEAMAMQQYLLENGVFHDRILVEDRSTSTYENILFSMQAFQLSNVIIVTNDYHMYRSKWIANGLGLHAYGLAAPTPKKAIMKSYMREYAAILHTWLTNY